MIDYKLDLKVEGMTKDITYIKEKIDTIVQDNKTEHKEIMNILSCLDGKYASKLTEKIVYGLCALILVAFVTKITNIW